MSNVPAIALTPDAQGRPTCLSLDVARHFQKKHSHVLRDIDRLRSILPPEFIESNFGFNEYTDKIGRKLRAFRLTRNAFSLLAMGFTGKAAVMWKLRYIEAFNALEAAALEHHSMLAREAGYQQGLDEARSLPAMQAERQAGYLAGLREGQRLWQRRSSPRALLRMAELHGKGLTWREVGKIMGISGDAARKRVGRAAQRGLLAATEAPHA